MAPKGLLRYIFRHGPHAKARAATKPPCAVSNEPKDTASATSNKPAPYPKVTPFKDDSESPLTYKIRPDSQESQRSSILEDIAEEIVSDDDKSSSGETITPFEHNIQALGTRELLTATLYEARIATHAHLDSIDATLGLLDALDGFSVQGQKGDVRGEDDYAGGHREGGGAHAICRRGIMRRKSDEEEPVAHGRRGLELRIWRHTVKLLDSLCASSGAGG
jgi:hypothetical protein